MEKLGFGIIGCGVIGPLHAEAIASLETAQLVAVADIVESRARALAVKYSVPCFLDYRELLQLPKVNVVNICVPSGLHAQIGIDAARAGKHVVVEKPIDTTLKKADQLIQTCREKGVKLAVISQHRFDPGAKKLKEVIEEGELGRLILGDAYVKWYRTQDYYDIAPWRGTLALDGGAALINQSIHTIDLLLWMMGEVKTLFAYTDRFVHQIEGEDVGVAVIRFGSGALGVIEGSTATYPGFPERLEIHGENGSVVLEGGKSTISSWEFKTPVAPLPLEEETAVTGAVDPRALAIASHRSQIVDMIEAITTGRPPLVSGEDGRKALEVILAINQSAGKKKEVSLPLIEE